MGKYTNFYGKGGNTLRGKKLRSNIALSEELIHTGQTEDNIKYILSVIDECINSGKFKTALRLLRGSLKSSPESSALWYRKSICYKNLSDLHSSLAAIKRAIKYDPFEIRYSIESGILLLLDNKVEAADKHFKNIISSHPSDEDIIMQIASAYEVNSFYLQAIQLYRYFLEKNPDSPKVLFQIGYCYDLQNDYQNAISYYDEYLLANPECPTGWFNKGVNLERLEQISEAINCYHTSLLLNPNYTEACFNLGNLYADTKRFEEAAICYNRVLEIDPDYSSAKFNLGVIAEEQESFSEAIEKYTQVLKDDPANQDALLYRGQCEFIHDNFSQAVVNFRNALACNQSTNEQWANFDELGSQIDENDVNIYKSINFNEAVSDYFTFTERLGILLRLRKYEESLLYISIQHSLSKNKNFDYFSAAKIHFIKNNSNLGYLYLNEAFKSQSDAFRMFTAAFPKVAASKLFESLFNIRLA